MPTATNTIAMNAPNVETKTAAVPFCKKMTWGLSGALGSHMLEVHISNAVMAICGVIIETQANSLTLTPRSCQDLHPFPTMPTMAPKLLDPGCGKAEVV